jgi:hypothetical protein
MKTRKTNCSLLAPPCILALAAHSLLLAAPEEAKKNAPVAVIAGTVFRQPGFALPGAQVTIRPERDKEQGTKFKKSKIITNSRGEFAVRVPPVPMKYSVDVHANGYISQSKTVEIYGEQWKEISFLLDPKPAGEKK